MPFTVTMPKLSPTMEEGAIAKWHKNVGDYVEAGDVLLEVSTDKATIEYNALDSGWLRRIIIPEGKEAIVNQPIAIFTEEKEEGIEGYQPEAVDAPSAQKTELPKTQEAPPPKAKGLKPSFAPERPLEKETPSLAPEEKRRTKASPLARKLAKEQGLNISEIKGSGPGGRIMKRDLTKAGTMAFGEKELPKIAPGSYEEEPLTPMRKVIGQRLQEAKSSIPHFYVALKINAQPLVDLRDQLKHVGAKATYNDMIVRACALALRQHPTVNSGFNSENNSLIRFKTIDISVAVSVQGGLITPIIRFADYKSLNEISQEIKELAARAKEGKLEAHEYKGGSFTVSNLGMYGISEFSAIINPPQGAILAISGIFEVPMIRNGQVVPGLEMTLTLSSDHRVIDGVAASEFLKTLQKFLENPATLLV